MRGAVALTAAVVLAGGTVTAALGEERSTDRTLLARHAPVLVLHPAELFAPATVDGFLADSDLLERAPDGSWVPFRPERGDSTPLPGDLAAAGANSRLDQHLCQAVDGPPSEPCYADAQSAHPSIPTTYGAVFRRSGKIILQYWLWYPVNLYSPTVPAGPFWINHEGDWEAVTVVLDAKERPQLVGLSSHCGGQRRAWRDAPKRGSRPVVYVAKGSHANYFTMGDQRVSASAEPLLRRCFGAEFLAIYKAYGVPLVDHTGAGRVVRPSVVPVTVSQPEWMRFRGTWGEDRYIGFPNVEPFRNGASPVGPAFHDQWRRPLAVPLAWPVG